MRFRKRVREYITEEVEEGEVMYYLPHGDISLDFKNPKDARMMIDIVKAFKYVDLDEMYEMCEMTITRDELEISSDALVIQKIMCRYIINGQKFYVLNSEKKEKIKEIIGE